MHSVLTTAYIGKMCSQAHLTFCFGSRSVGSRLGEGEMSRGIFPTEEDKEVMEARFCI